MYMNILKKFIIYFKKGALSVSQNTICLLLRR